MTMHEQEYQQPTDFFMKKKNKKTPHSLLFLTYNHQYHPNHPHPPIYTHIPIFPFSYFQSSRSSPFSFLVAFSSFLATPILTRVRTQVNPNLRPPIQMYTPLQALQPDGSTSTWYSFSFFSLSYPHTP